MTRESDTRDGSDTRSGDGGNNLLADLRTGAWLDSQEFPPLVYAVDGLVPEGFALLVGPPKAGKSWLALDLLLAVAAGGRALGAIPVGAPRRVLYCALEDGDRRMQDRCRQLLSDASIPERFCYITRVQPGTILATITAFVERYPDTALVVVDTLGRVMPTALQGESAYQRDYRVGAALKGIADEHPGLAVTVLHHDRKATSDDFVDSVSGTHGLAGAADTIVVLARKRQAQDALLKVTGRDVVEAEYALRLRGGTWTLDGATLAESAETARRREEQGDLGETSAAILEFVGERTEGVRTADVVEKFGENARKYLTRLEESGRLIKPCRGWYCVNRFGTQGER
ncbi:AAA family ATPase [Allosalinactinospora lopnorensis]|uniref:AAA family ATPase n=1 Tax=Allosalinactinospora lopnorensis TaxID=1352348 RepID=UPI000623C1A3|nr:AAA family ATPase [Allosalinactinospora lopnorensis]